MSTLASSQMTDRKNSGYSTYEEDDYFEDVVAEICEQFYNYGACMKGDHCHLLHEGK